MARMFRRKNETNDYINTVLAEGRRRLAKRNHTFDPPPERRSVKLQRAENDAAARACKPNRRK